MELKFRKVKRRCDVRRCTNTDCYSISYSSEPGNTVIICPECIAKANAMINPTVKEAKKAEKPAVKDEPKKAPEKKAEKDDAE